MIKTLSTSSTLQICSKCLSYEINNWMNDKWEELDEETKRKINEELRAIKLKPGKCIVCENNLVSADTTKRIFEILEENNILSKIKEEFQKFFLVEE